MKALSALAVLMSRLALAAMFLAHPLRAATPSAATNDVEKMLRRMPVWIDNPVMIDELKRALPSITKPDERSLALAVYCLGNLAAENVREAQAARDRLALEFPGHRYLGYLTLDQLVRPCKACDNSGKAREKCIHCRGNGNCAECHGRGKFKLGNGKTGTCARCAGTGKCPACKGKGGSEVACKECGGKGRIWDKQRIRRIAHGLIRLGPGVQGDPEDAEQRDRK